jgi:hypothetical protein
LKTSTLCAQPDLRSLALPQSASFGWQARVQLYNGCSINVDTRGLAKLVPGAHSCRLVASDRHYVDEAVTTLKHPQVMLAWLMNEAPIPPRHGAPLRLLVPFRYGNRSIKAITEMVFATPGLPMPPLPA